MTIFFDVVGDPVASPRPRVMHLGSARARIYVPSTADKWKRLVRAAATSARGAERELLAPGVAVEVHMAFRFARPRSHFRSGRFSAILRPDAPRHHTQKPDRDNLEKAVLDALGGFQGLPPLVWCDDCQVVTGRTMKRWAAPDEPPGVTVAIMEFHG